MDSILDSVKNYLGVELDYTGFDQSIILGINSALMDLNQLGVGPTSGFSIASKEELWSTFLESKTDREAAKTFVCMKTRLFFDPPTTAHLVESLNRLIEETAFRLTVQVYVPPVDPVVPVE